MKRNSLRRTGASVLTFAIMLMLAAPSLLLANATNDKSTPLPNSLAASREIALYGMRNQDARKDYSREDLEQMRSALLDLVEANREVSALLPANSEAKIDRAKGGNSDEYEDVRNQISKMSDKDLSKLRSVLNPAAMQEKLNRSRAVIADLKNTANTTGLPDVNSVCGNIGTAAIIAADVIYFTAEAVRDIAQDGCNEVIVILGEGGNGRLVCLVTDAIYIIAKAVYEGIHFCDTDYAASVGQAAFDRLGHIHTDLESSISNDDANKTAIVNNDNINKTAIITNDNTNKTAIITNDDANKLAIVTNDDTNTATLSALITAALNSIITNANANKDELKNLVLRTQIEADLAAADSATPVAIFQTPSTTCTTPSIPNPLTQCGYLNLVAAIVRESIVNQGGPNMAAALALAAQGDAQKATGQFRAAYTTYRKAYKTAAK